MRIEFDREALRALESSPDVEQFVGDFGQEVADRANARAETLFTHRGGGGVGSIESHVEHDDEGRAYARVAYPPKHSYMWIHEVGSEHEKARPHIRPALYGTKDATGGKDSTTRKNRGAAKARRTVKRSSSG